MEYLIPLLVVLGAAVLTGLIAFWFLRARRNNLATSADGTSSTQRAKGAERISQASAAQASARLDEDTHRKIYRFIAAGDIPRAAQLYKNSTGVGTIQTMLDIQALAQYPQEWVSLESARSAENFDKHTPDQDEPSAEEQSPGTEEDSLEPATTDPNEQPVTDLTVPADWIEEPKRETPRGFQVEVVRDDGTVQLSSDDLPPWLRDQLQAMVRDGRIDAAAETLAEHTLLTVGEAHDLIEILRQQQSD